MFRSTKSRSSARTRAERGAAAVEAVLLLPFCLIFGVAIVYLGRGHSEESKAFVDARQQAWVAGRSASLPLTAYTDDKSRAMDDGSGGRNDVHFNYSNLIFGALLGDELDSLRGGVGEFVTFIDKPFRYPIMFSSLTVFEVNGLVARDVSFPYTGAGLQPFKATARHTVVLYTAPGSGQGWFDIRGFVNSWLTKKAPAFVWLAEMIFDIFGVV